MTKFEANEEPDLQVWQLYPLSLFQEKILMEIERIFFFAKISAYACITHIMDKNKYYRFHYDHGYTTEECI